MRLGFKNLKLSQLQSNPLATPEKKQANATANELPYIKTITEHVSKPTIFPYGIHEIQASQAQLGIKQARPNKNLLLDKIASKLESTLPTDIILAIRDGKLFQVNNTFKSMRSSLRLQLEETTLTSRLPEKAMQQLTQLSFQRKQFLTCIRDQINEKIQNTIDTCQQFQTINESQSTLETKIKSLTDLSHQARNHFNESNQLINCIKDPDKYRDLPNKDYLLQNAKIGNADSFRLAEGLLQRTQTQFNQISTSLEKQNERLYKQIKTSVSELNKNRRAKLSPQQLSQEKELITRTLDALSQITPISSLWQVKADRLNDLYKFKLISRLQKIMKS